MSSNINNTVQLSLPFADEEVITIHCFFRCRHVVQSVDLSHWAIQTAHDLMEQHYTEKHSHQIDLIVARLK
jgi:hypothetical protein